VKQKKNQFRHESLQDAASIRKVLEAVTDGLAKGKLRFSDDDGELLLHPRGLLDLRLSADQDEGRQRINLRVSWQVKEKKGGRKKALNVSSD
jgi:amphi-Trp domain-containing protein